MTALILSIEVLPVSQAAGEAGPSLEPIGSHE